MRKKLTSTERIGLLLTGILIIVACIAMAVIPRWGAEPVAEIPAPVQQPDSTSKSEKSPVTSAPTKPVERNYLNEEF